MSLCRLGVACLCQLALARLDSCFENAWCVAPSGGDVAKRMMIEAARGVTLEEGHMDDDP